MPEAKKEKGYEPHQQRVVDEKSELDEKTGKLGEFFSTEIYESLPEDEQTDLGAQHRVMEAYSDILGRRIARF